MARNRPGERGNPEPSALAEMAGAIYRRRLLVISAALAPAIAAGLLFGLLRSPVYISEARLLVSGPVEEAGLKSEQTFLEALLPDRMRREQRAVLAFLSSRRLQEELFAAHDLAPRLYDSALSRLALKLRRGLAVAPSLRVALQDERLLDFFTAETSQKTGVVELSMEDVDSRRAAAVLTTAIEKLKSFLESEYETEAGRKRAFLEKRLAEAAARLARLEAAAPDARRSKPQLEREILAASRIYAELEVRLAMARADEAAQRVAFRVLDPPLAPHAPAGPSWLLAALLGLAAGLFAGAFLACMAEAAARRPDATRRD